MIVTKLYGGLGNQMFIYATAKALSLRKKVDLIVNRNDGFEKDLVYNRSYALSDFNIKLKENRFLSFDYTWGHYVSFISRRVGRHLFCPRYKFIQENLNNYRFEDLFFKKGNSNLIINGYWQNEAYFKDYEDEIRADFSFKKTFPKETLVEAQFIEQNKEKVVALGVRLYQECKDGTSPPLVDENYFEKTMDYFSKKLDEPIFVVFTQVPQWVRENIESKNKYKIVYAQEKEAIDDLFLMTLFKYYIISNSSLYWWGAWLSKNNDKIVLAPQNKFPNKATIPKSWIQF